MGQLMSSVTVPIFDRRNHTVRPQIILFTKFLPEIVFLILSFCLFILNVLFLFQQREANLLGVVGTDVPIDQLKKLVPPYKVKYTF